MTSTTARYDTSRRRWRHLDFGACQVWLEADIHRIDCRSCARVRTEQVLWARPGARHTSDFENVAAWLAQRMDKASIARQLRCSWETVDAIVTRVVTNEVVESVYRAEVPHMPAGPGIGHADPASTLRVYAHLAPESPQRARCALDALPGGLPGVDGPKPCLSCAGPAF